MRTGSRLWPKAKGWLLGFGNEEGTGRHSHWIYAWKTGQRQRFLVTAKPTGPNHTIYSGYYFHPEKSQWILISVGKAPKEGATCAAFTAGKSWGANGHLRRKALFGNQWVRTRPGVGGSN
ncbi:MAG: DUF3472 domain-containing protein [Verrucomicrobiota bacterium]